MMPETPAPARVLVVDDDESGRYVVESLLSSAGYEVPAASDGEEALRIARKAPPDLLITDILMPRMDGYRLMREWTADSRLRHVPVMFYTATYTDPDDERFALGLGAARFMRKPQEPDDLLAVVGDVLGEKRVADGSQGGQGGEAEVLREYSERLVGKLEHKIVELDSANAELRHVVEVLSEEMGVKNALVERLNRDIQDRLRAEGGLREATETLDAVIDSSPLAIMAVDSEADIRLWNAAAERLLGWRRDEVLGHKSPAVPEELVAQQRGMVESTRQGEHIQGVETKRRRKDGSEVDVAVFSAPARSAEGKPYLAVAVFEDVTERRRIERLKGDFITTIGCRLREPLGELATLVDSVREIGAKATSDECMRLAERIREKTRELDSLVGRVLEAAAVEAGSAALSPAPTDVGAMVEEQVSRSDVPEGVTVDVSIAPGLPAALVDGDRLGGAVGDLLANALQHSPPGGRVAVSARAVGGNLLLSVTDQGEGVSESQRRPIFEPFTSVEAPGEEPSGRLGLGLYEVKRVAEAHGGRVLLTSEPGAGAEFTIEIPLAVG